MFIQLLLLTTYLDSFLCDIPATPHCPRHTVVRRRQAVDCHTDGDESCCLRRSCDYIDSSRPIHPSRRLLQCHSNYMTTHPHFMALRHVIVCLLCTCLLILSPNKNGMPTHGAKTAPSITILRCSPNMTCFIYINPNI